MGSYITGLLIALCLVLGLYLSVEISTGNAIFAQERLEEENADQLRAIAEDFKSKDQVEAIIQLGNRPGELGKTVPILAKLSTVRNELIKNAADASLEAIGAPAAEHLKVFMDEGTSRGYRTACSAMRAIGPGCKIYIDDLNRLLEHEQVLYRKCALYALQGIGEDGKEAMEGVIKCVLDEDMNNQCSACRVLETFGQDAIEAEKELLNLLENGGPSTRGWAAVCLGAIGPTSSDVDVVELLAKALGPQKNRGPVTPVEQERILIGLAHLGPEAASAVDIVKEKMNGENLFVSGHAAYAFWRITGDTEKPLAAIKRQLANTNYESDGLFVISKMGNAAAPLIDDVARKLGSSEPGTREIAVTAIGNMGKIAKEFIPQIEERLEDTDALVRMSARRALSSLVDKTDAETKKPDR